MGEIAGGVNLSTQHRARYQPFILGRGIWAKADSGKISIFLTCQLQTFFVQHRPQDFRVENELKIHRAWPQQLLAARVLWIRIKNPFTDPDLSLGDDNGLRGFGLRGRTGTKLLLFNLESRFHSQIRLWLLRLGFTTFLDLGEVWDEKQAMQLNALKSSFGFGLRLGNGRYSAQITRMDFAYNTYYHRWQISISTGSYFSAYKTLGFLNGFATERLQ